MGGTVERLRTWVVVGWWVVALRRRIGSFGIFREVRGVVRDQWCGRLL